MFGKLLIGLLILSLLSCNGSDQPSVFSKDTSSIPVEELPIVYEPISRNAPFTVDTIYKDINWKLTVSVFDPSSKQNIIPNAVFTVGKLQNGQYTNIYSDSIYSETGRIVLINFNNDKVKDILIENHADVRGNLHHYLYMVDAPNNKLTKIKWFNQIKNPNYLPQYNLVDNYVMSGTNWTGFYKIQGDTVHDYGIVIYDNQSDDGSYKRDHEKAIQLILSAEKNQ